MYTFKAIIIFHLFSNAILWPNHDITTLKLLQIVFRHGDRTPITFLSNDPYREVEKWWPQGLGELTNKGKHRMYKLGQFIRNEYKEYLGDGYSPREVYARSSIKRRCIESVSCFFAGAYPPKNNEWQWKGDEAQDKELGSLWQPIPIETFMPITKDNLLTNEQRCPIADKNFKNLLKNVDYLDQSSIELLKYIEQKAGQSPQFNSTIFNAIFFLQNLDIEEESGYPKWWTHGFWNQTHENYIRAKLTQIIQRFATLAFDDKTARLRGSQLIAEIANNFAKFVNNTRYTRKMKLFAYSTHDDKIATTMSALKIFNAMIVPFGATVLFELHSNQTDNYFVRIYYYNDTLTHPYLMSIPVCNNFTDCPFELIYNYSREITPNDWYAECGYNTSKSDDCDAYCGYDLSKNCNSFIAYVIMTVLINLIFLLITILVMFCKRFAILRKRLLSLI